MTDKFTEVCNYVDECVANDKLTANEAEVIKEEAFEKYSLSGELVYTAEAAWSKVISMKKELEKIKKAKPKEYDGPEETKAFVDKNYDDLIKCANILEKEPEKIRWQDIKAAIIFSCGIIGSIILVPVVPIVGILGYIISVLVIPTIWVIIKWLRNNADIENINNLTKIKESLNKLESKKKLPEKYKNKISDLISAIDDAETSVRAKLKVSKESVTETKLSVYEAFTEGVIDEEEKDHLLQMVEGCEEGFDEAKIKEAQAFAKKREDLWDKIDVYIKDYDKLLSAVLAAKCVKPEDKEKAKEYHAKYEELEKELHDTDKAYFSCLF